MRRVGIVYNHRLPAAVQLATRLVEHLGLTGDAWCHSAAEVERMGEEHPGPDVLITVGGDGTILRATRIAAPHGIPLLGINLGHVGFLTELGADEAPKAVRRYLEGPLRVDERTMLRAEVRRPGVREDVPREFHALNEVVVGTRGISRMVTVRAEVDGALLAEYRADAVILATATGSTGHAFSAGGPILYPWSRDMVLKPVAAYLGLAAGVVLPSTSRVRLTVLSDSPTVLKADGFMDSPMEQGDEAIVQVGPMVARFLRANPPAHYYATLAQRLGIRDHSLAPGPLRRGATVDRRALVPETGVRRVPQPLSRRRPAAGAKGKP